jgi:hypothetical protein
MWALRQTLQSSVDIRLVKLCFQRFKACTHVKARLDEYGRGEGNKTIKSRTRYEWTRTDTNRQIQQNRIAFAATGLNILFIN